MQGTAGTDGGHCRVGGDPYISASAFPKDYDVCSYPRSQQQRWLLYPLASIPCSPRDSKAKDGSQMKLLPP